MSIFYGMPIDIFADSNREIDEWLTQLKYDLAVADFRIVCDETNNTEETIANNELYIDLFIEQIPGLNTISFETTCPEIDYFAITRAVSSGTKINQENLE